MTDMQAWNALRAQLWAREKAEDDRRTRERRRALDAELRAVLEARTTGPRFWTDTWNGEW